MATNKKLLRNEQCKICDEPAVYSYFGAVVCQACKMFFKRNAENTKKILICPFNDQCEINALTRHACSACRLRKCLQNGMQTTLIRHSTHAKRRIRQYEKALTPPQQMLPVMNLVRTDTSSLTRDQWTLLTNLTYLYDQFQIFNLAQRLGPSSPTVDATIVKGLLTAFYEESGHACRRNADFQALSLSDRSVLLPTAIDNIICLGGVYTCVQAQLLHHQGYMSHLDAAYGPLMTAHHRWATTFVKCDDILFKLALALFALSTHSRTFQRNLNEEYLDVKPMLEIESRYAELTWKYLLYRYSLKEAIERYVQLIRWFLAVTVFMYHAQSSARHVKDVQTLAEDVEMNLILDDVDEVIAKPNEVRSLDRPLSTSSSVPFE